MGSNAQSGQWTLGHISFVQVLILNKKTLLIIYNVARKEVYLYQFLKVEFFSQN